MGSNSLKKKGKSGSTLSRDLSPPQRPGSSSAVHGKVQLPEILEAVSAVFPEERIQKNAFQQPGKARVEPEFEDERASDRRDEVPHGAENQPLWHELELFESEIKLSRKYKRARMALAGDWSELPAYLRESLSIWRDRLALRSEYFRLRLGLSRSLNTCELISPEHAPTVEFNLPPLALADSVRNADLRLRLEQLGVRVVSEQPESVVKSGWPALDAALQTGGFPRGRIIEIFGKESSGKTTVALRAAGRAQQGGNCIAFLDAEHKIDLSWARLQGINLDRALILRTAKALDTLESMLEIIRSGEFALVILDTLAALVPGDALEASHGEFSGEIGRLLARTLPRIASAASQSNTCVLLLNQIRHNHEEVFGRVKISPGGHALAHFCSIRLELARMAGEKRANNVVGCRTKATVIKNCVGSPWRTAELNIGFGGSADFVEIA